MTHFNCNPRQTNVDRRSLGRSDAFGLTVWAGANIAEGHVKCKKPMTAEASGSVGIQYQIRMQRVAAL